VQHLTALPFKGLSVNLQSSYHSAVVGIDGGINYSQIMFF